jgi:uncharacterized protein (UPF0216 family)
VDELSFLSEVLDREIQLVNDDLVRPGRKLVDLLSMESSALPTVGGGLHLIGHGQLRELDEQLPEGLKERLLLPITFCLQRGAVDRYYLSDRAALEALQHLGDLDRRLVMREGKAWFPRRLGNDLVRRRPGLIQFMVVEG